MRTWLFSVLAVALACAALARTAAGDPPKARQYEIEVSVRQGDPLGSPEEGTVKVLAEPRVITIEGREATIVTGGEAVLPGDSTPTQLGHTVRINPECAKDGKVRVRVTLERAELVEKKENRAVLRTTQVRHVRLVKSDEIVRLRWDRDDYIPMWAELRVRECRTD